MAKLVVFTVALTVPAARVLRGLGRRGLRRARGQAGPDGGEAPHARAARQGDSGRDSREARSQEGVTSGLAATDLRTLLHHVCARDPQGVLRRKNCRRLSVKYLDICCVILYILQKNNATGLVTLLIFDVFCPRPFAALPNRPLTNLSRLNIPQKAGVRVMRTPAFNRDGMLSQSYT